MPNSIRERVRSLAPALFVEIDSLASNWLDGLLKKIRTETNLDFRAKQINDPIWGIVEILPWEVALLDTPLLQRMRGVRQLGLAHLVFPGAHHGRLEHIIGVVGAIEEVINSISRQIDRWNRNNKNFLIPTIDEGQRYAVRLAGLLHDIGHGPFSHALEPVLEIDAPLGESVHATDGWRSELRLLRDLFGEIYELNKRPSSSEAISVAIIFSQAMQEILASDKIITQRSMSGEILEETIVAAIIGAVSGPGATFLSAVVSSQIDADKLDYLQRDAHQSGLEIGFDTDRLMAKLEILRIRQDNLDPSAVELRERAAQSPEGMFLQLGLAASGFGSFEQMLIGRTFLYDRVYHHHKVRAAEAMAQRLMLVAERDRDQRFSLREIFLNVDDDTFLRIFSTELNHNQLVVSSGAAAALARGILDRDLFHRAYAFRGRFISLPPGTDYDEIERSQSVLWGRIVKDLGNLKNRYELGVEIYNLSRRCLDTFLKSDTRNFWNSLDAAMRQIGPEQIIVDLPGTKTERISILARYPNGAIRLPEFSFNPQRWSDAYELQKRTGYVFCPKGVAQIIGLASKIVFLVRFGAVMIEEADGYIKARTIDTEWIEPLVADGIIDREIADLISARRYSLIAIKAEDLQIPQNWQNEDPDLSTRMSINLQRLLNGGLTSEHLAALSKVLSAMYSFVDMWFDSHITSKINKEAELQDILRNFLKAHSLKVEEGSRVSGGALDLFVENSIITENKFSSSPSSGEEDSPSAGMQGRRYAISLGSQIVIVVSAYMVKSGQYPNKSKCLSIRPISQHDKNRAEIRFAVPFGAVVPSHENHEKNRKSS